MERLDSKFIQVTNKHLNVVDNPRFSENCLDLRIIQELYGVNEFLLAKPIKVRNDDYEYEILNMMQLGIKNIYIPIPTFVKINNEFDCDYKGYFSHEILSLNFTYEHFKHSLGITLDLPKLLKDININCDIKFAASRIVHVLSNKSTHGGPPNKYDVVKELSVYSIANTHINQSMT